MINKVREFGNYLLTIYDQSNEEFYYNIKGSLIDVPEFLIPQVLRSFRQEDDTENTDDTKSQLYEWGFVYGLDLNNDEIKTKLLEYLNDFLNIKDSL